MLDPALRQLTPDFAVLVGSCGLCLIFWEFNRPGRILPGAGGLLLLLLAAASVLRWGVAPGAGILLLGCALALLLDVWRQVPWPLLLFVVPAAIVSLHGLLSAGSGKAVSLPVATLCGGGLSILSASLTRIAYRARRAKALD